MPFPPPAPCALLYSCARITAAAPRCLPPARSLQCPDQPTEWAGSCGTCDGDDPEAGCTKCLDYCNTGGKFYLF